MNDVTHARRSATRASAAMMAAMMGVPVMAAQVAPRPQASAINPAGPVLPLTELPMSKVDASRMTVPVSMADGAPLAFIVDTGAERSGIASDVAARYGIRSSGMQSIVGFASKRSVPTVRLPSIRYAKTDHHNLEALLFSRSLIGADGFLGIDSLGDQRIEFDFVRERIFLQRSGKRPLRRSSTSQVVKVVENQGRLIFANANVDQIKSNVILDTGSSLTIGNDALRDHLSARGKIRQTIPVYVRTMTGEIIPAQYAIVRRVTIGNVPIDKLPIAFATIEPFKQLGINDSPALLLGMDALRVFSTVIVDFPQRSVRFTSREKPTYTTATRIPEAL